MAKGSIIGGIIGAIIGYFAGGNVYAGWTIGYSLGSYYDARHQDDIRQEGPKLDDLKAQISSYGGMIYYIRGAMRVAGNIIDATDLVAHTTETHEESGGKGGGGGPDVVTTTTSYTVSVDIALCGYRETVRILKVWANKKLIYDWATSQQSACIGQMRVYNGSESQDPDPLFTAIHGTAPAYRGITHVVLQDLDVTTDFFNRIPLLEFLILADESGEFSGVRLDEIVTDICALSGIDASDIDVIDLDEDIVSGYCITSPMTGRAAIEPLQQGFYFDAVESDDVLKFVKRDGSIVGTMLQEDRAGPGGELDSDLQITHMSDDLELPNQVDVTYMDVDADYLSSTQYERRITRNTISTAGLNLPIAMTGTKAKECASVALYASYLRQSFAWSTTRKYANYEPTDVITLPTAAATYTARITSKRDTVGGRIEWEAKAEDDGVYSPNVAAALLSYTPATIEIPPPTTVRLLDINLMRDQDDANGFYATATGVEPWRGAQLARSIDTGQSYHLLTSFTSPSCIGSALTALGNWTGGEIFEYLNSVDVLIIRGGLSNATQDEVLNGSNFCVVGDEILQFTTATLIDVNTYRLSGLLRGRRGTDFAKSTHLIGDRFVFGEIATWRNILQDNASIGRSYKYRAVTFGERMDQSEVFDFTNNAARLKPYSPAQVQGVRDGSNNLTITWVPRSRVDGEWRDLVETPLSDSDIYDIDVYNPGYTILKRTIASIAGPSQVYSAANQTTDGYTPGDPVSIDVFQKSTAVGRGYGRRVII